MIEKLKVWVIGKWGSDLLPLSRWVFPWQGIWKINHSFNSLKKHCWLTQNLLRMILVFFKLFLKLVFVTVAKYNGTVQTQHSAASHYPRGTLNSCSLYNWCILFLKSWIWVLIDALYSTSSLDWSWLSFMYNCAYSFWKQKVSSCQ